jgi:alanine racemase
LAVALVEEGIALREAGIDSPILLLSEPPEEAMAVAVGHQLTPTVYTLPAVVAAGSAASDRDRVVDVQVKVDTGMHRVGAGPGEVMEIVDAVAANRALRLQGLWTHLAVADGTDSESRLFTDDQLRQFDDVRADLTRRGLEVPLFHAANSAGTIAHPVARYDLVRTGIALYGLAPSPSMVLGAPEVFGSGGLRPVLSLRARVSFVRHLEKGARPSYGRLRALGEASVVATVPIGYADGVPRDLFDAGATVLIGGRRCPIAGAVTMDQIMVDCGPDAEVRPGDEVVLIGRQGGEESTATDWASMTGTISYEVLCGIGPRVPRVVVDR